MVWSPVRNSKMALAVSRLVSKNPLIRGSLRMNGAFSTIIYSD